MRIAEFKDPDRIVYADINQFADNFGKEVGISDLRAKIEEFRSNPCRDGQVLSGVKRTTLRLLIPNEYFDEKIEMGETVWVYMGELYEIYCLYWPVQEC